MLAVRCVACHVALRLGVTRAQCHRVVDNMADVRVPDAGQRPLAMVGERCKKKPQSVSLVLTDRGLYLL